MDTQNLISLLQNALLARLEEGQDPLSAQRLFNGFSEGFPSLSVERFGDTLVLLNNAKPAEELFFHLPGILGWIEESLPAIKTVLIKDRRDSKLENQRGRLLKGHSPATRIKENGVYYALNLTLNRGVSFYLDTRNLRAWARNNLQGVRVLNTFAYTGSLGVAALVGKAARVIQTDLNKNFLHIAKQSTQLNRFPVQPKDFLAGDFFSVMARLRGENALFDCIFLDAPFFSSTAKGRVDLLKEYHRLINKVRPLLADNGRLVAVNNALFLSGEDYMSSLQALCADGYLSLEERIPVPADCVGFSAVTGSFPADPAPFNYPTKIAILRAKRKDGRG